MQQWLLLLHYVALIQQGPVLATRHWSAVRLPWLLPWLSPLCNMFVTLVLLLVCACHQRASLTELTVPPGCLGLDPRGILIGRTRTVFASPGVGNVLFFPPSTTNHYRADGVVPAGAALPVKLIAECVQTMKLICSPFGILFGLGECRH